ncbi:MAG TPA: hypothetical protein VLA04_01480 [Verrucomicrobiae bacterium]|nr:hypothetical protein [Verrucomicrobiae bacterium]
MKVVIYGAVFPNKSRLSEALLSDSDLEGLSATALEIVTHLQTNLDIGCTYCVKVANGNVYSWGVHYPDGLYLGSSVDDDQALSLSEIRSSLPYRSS